MAMDCMKIEYILDMLTALQQQSREANADMLCYLLELSIVEARENLQDFGIGPSRDNIEIGDRGIEKR